MSISDRRGSTVSRVVLHLLCTLMVTAVFTSVATAQEPGPLAFLAASEVSGSSVLARDGYAVVIDLDANELHFMRGMSVLWSAPVGTGMGLRLETEERKWEFSTPAGEYQVQYKEENPAWYAPDWYFIENKLPVPPSDDPRRRFPGGLGAAAVYIGLGLAIHGTDKPDLLGQRVSHGCIRLSNDDAQRLFHNVQVGTKVIIVGGEWEDDPGELVPGEVPGAGQVDARTERLRQSAKTDRERRLRQLGALSVDSLQARLAAELAAPEPGSRWSELAGELVQRAVKQESVEAARVLLEEQGTARDPSARAEYTTFLADLSRRAASQTVLALAEMDAHARNRAARAIVEGALGLYSGEVTDAVAPWPTRRVPSAMTTDDAASGWEALVAAERRYREAQARQARAAG